jgi:hypothetical protein
MMQSVNEKIALAVLVLLALSNLVFFVVSSYSGPIVGIIVATATAFHWWRKRNSMLIVVVAIIWIFLHIYELVAMGAGSQPVLFYLNLLLPTLLLFCGLKEKRLKSIRPR